MTLAAHRDQGVLGYLGRALSLELSAAQLYRTQARLLSSWGLAEPAARLRAESEEEMQHVDRIIERMLEVGVVPSASQLRPVTLGQSLAELLQVNQSFEEELISLYRDAVAHCARTGCHDDRVFFEGLVEDEQAHFDELVDWLRRVQGETKCGQH